MRCAIAPHPPSSAHSHRRAAAKAWSCTHWEGGRRLGSVDHAATSAPVTPYPPCLPSFHQLIVPILRGSTLAIPGDLNAFSWSRVPRAHPHTPAAKSGLQLAPDRCCTLLDAAHDLMLHSMGHSMQHSRCCIACGIPHLASQQAACCAADCTAQLHNCGSHHRDSRYWMLENMHGA
jgi:hypothetical protein